METANLIQYFPVDCDKIAYFKDAVVELCDAILADPTTDPTKNQAFASIRAKIMIDL